MNLVIIKETSINLNLNMSKNCVSFRDKYNLKLQSYAWEISQNEQRPAWEKGLISSDNFWYDVSNYP